MAIAIVVLGFGILLVTVGGYLSRSSEDPSHSDRLVTTKSFLRDLSAHQLLSAYQDLGAGAVQPTLVKYEEQLLSLFPAGDVLSPDIIPPTGNVLSLTIAPGDLLDKSTGVLTNSVERGIEWERPGLLSYYKSGELVFRSRAGIRTHGGWVRESPKHRHILSLRAYFRPAFRSENLAASVIWPEVKGRLSRLIILKRNRGLRNRVGFGIARRLGSPSPYTVPVRFYLNGNDEGVKFISEHISWDYLEAHYGHRDFVFHRFKDTPRNSLDARYQAMQHRARSREDPITLKEVEPLIDVRNLFAQYAAFLMVELYDSFQGAILLNKRQKDARWFFVNWDMEASFNTGWARRKFYEKYPEVARQDYFSHMGQGTAYRLRHMLWRGLEHDVEFRNAFSGFLVEAFNHKLTTKWLIGMMAKHARMMAENGEVDPSHHKENLNFLLGQRRKIFETLDKHWNTGAHYKVTVRAPAGIMLHIDGYAIESRYTGRYLESTPIHISVPPEQKNLDLQWTVNGAPIDRWDGERVLNISSDTRIQAVRREEKREARTETLN